MSLNNLLTENSINLNCGTLSLNTSNNNKITIDGSTPYSTFLSGSTTTTNTVEHPFLTINLNPSINASIFLQIQVVGVITGGPNSGHAIYQSIYLAIKYLGGGIGYFPTTIVSDITPLPIDTAGISYENDVGDAFIDVTVFDSNVGDIVDWAWNCSVIIAV